MVNVVAQGNSGFDKRDYPFDIQQKTVLLNLTIVFG